MFFKYPLVQNHSIVSKLFEGEISQFEKSSVMEGHACSLPVTAHAELRLMSHMLSLTLCTARRL